MKKRFLALALCLVLATSLLPLTAAAEDITVQEVKITANGVKPNTEGIYAGKYGVNITSLKLKCANGDVIDAIAKGYTISSVLGTGMYNSTPTTEPLEPGTWYHLTIEIKPTDTLLPMSTMIPDSLTFTSGAYTTMPIGKVIRTDGILEIGFALQKNGAHDWDIRKEDSGTLTARCNDEDCTIGEVTVKLTAHSVTLPESPFNAEVQVEGDLDLKEAFPNADIGPLVYKYKGPGDSEYREIKPNAANAKAGEYQVGVQITGLPISPAAVAARGNQDNAGFADLYVQYTAVDPAITAQTGDNRPIELMLAGLVVFAALAAAAFALDSKRKYSR